MTWMAPCVAFFLLAACLHAAVRRIAPAVNTVTAYAACSSACGIALALCLLSPGSLGAVRAAAALGLYAFLSELYVFTFTFVFGSVSASVLLSHLGDAAPAAGEAPAPADVMIQRRLAGLCGAGLLSERHGSYEITAKGRLVAFLDRSLGAFFGHERPAPGGGAPAS
jgi:hypothetical protein